MMRPAPDDTQLRELLRHEAVQDNIVRGLSGGAALDNLIFAVEEALSLDEGDVVLQSGRTYLQETYPQAYATGSGTIGREKSLIAIKRLTHLATECIFGGT